MQTMKVKPWGTGQGDFVLIDVANFDPSVHEPLEHVKATSAVTSTKYEIKHLGAGKYAVLEGEERLNENSLTKAEAEAFIVTKEAEDAAALENAGNEGQ